MSELIDRQALIKQLKDENIPFNADINEIINIQPIAYDIDNVISEVKKLDLDGVSMVEDGKYKLVRKNEVISLIQTNGVCNGRHTTCSDCYKMNCPLSTEKTLTDKWSNEVKRGGE